MYRMAYGGSIGTLTYIWKIDPSLSDHEERNAHALLLVTETLPKYSTRDMKRTFIDNYTDVSNCSAMVLRHIYRELTEDASAASTLMQAEVDSRVAKFLLSADDTDLILDLRKLNGKPGSTKFDAFWTECQKFFDEHVAAVSERRHGADYLYLPFAISTEDLRLQVKARLPEDSLIPSAEWLRLQFWPSDPYTSRAIHHTGRFNIKFQVQSRLVRSEHPDCKYAAMLYKYLKHFAVKFRENCLMICLDDKATVPVGEPGKPQATGVRGHNRSLAPLDGPVLSAMDHDFHLAGIIPSVAFVLDIPDNPADSFFNGRVFVTCKDKIFEHSSPFRHGAELGRILENHLCAEGVLKQKMLLLYTDGGPDHRVTYGSVQVSLICMFIQFDLDILIAVRTAPGNSWTNLAETVMPVLNLALQNVALERSRMSPQMESLIKCKNTMHDVRLTAERFPQLETEYKESTEGVINLINSRFRRMQLKGTPLTTYQGVTRCTVDSFF